MPDYEQLLEFVGVTMEQAHPETAVLGTPIEIENGRGVLQSNAHVGSPVYNAGIELGDEILSIGGRSLQGVNSIQELMTNFDPGEQVDIVFERWGEQHTVQAELMPDPALTTRINTNSDSDVTERRDAWLNID